MADYKEELIQNLVTRLSIDKDAAEATIKEVQKYLQQNRAIAAAETELESLDYHASLDLRHAKLVEHYAALEKLIKEHGQKKMEIFKYHAEEEKKVAAELAEDLKKLEDRKKESLEENKKHHELGLKMGQEQMGLMKALGFADFAGFAGAMAGPMAMLTFLGGSLAQAHERIRESRVEGTKLAVSMGMESDVGSAMGLSVLELSRTRGVPKEQVESVMKAFSPIAGAGEAGVSTLNSLAGQALNMSNVTGAGAPDIARLMTNFKVLEDVDMKQLANRFMGIDYAAKEAGVTTQSFVGWLNTAIDAGKIYNVSIDESKNLIQRFSTELREGTLTMQQITQIQSTVARSPQGFRAFIGGKIAEEGGPLADYFASIGATTALGRSGAMEGIGEGKLMKDGKLYKPEEGSDDEKRVLMYRQLAEKRFSDYVEENMRRSSTNTAEWPELRQLFMGQIGLKGDTLFQTQELQGGLGADATKSVYAKAGGEMLEASKENQSAAIKQLEAANIGVNSQSRFRQMLNAQERGFEKTLYGMTAFYYNVIGDDDKQKIWEEKLESIGGEDTAERAKADLYKNYKKREEGRAKISAENQAFLDVFGPNASFKFEIYNNTDILLSAKNGKVTIPVKPGKIE